MKIEKLSYQITVPVASFQYDKIGVEASVDSDKEDISECFAQLRRTLDGLTREAYPHLYETTPFIQEHENQPLFVYKAPTDAEPEKFTEEDKEQNTLTCINECKDVKILMAFTKIKDKWPSTKSAYNKKYKELAKQ
jgi:hypothetical protein